MDTFLSWSGSRSKIVADALRNWLPGVLQSVTPWVSGADIEAGSRWHQSLTVRLNECNFGVICLTPENVHSPWLLYEAGALSKSVDGSSVVPYLLGLRKADVDGPLAHFQGVEADAEGTLVVLHAMNAVLARSGGRPLSESVLRDSFELWWPKLHEQLERALALEIPGGTRAAPRDADQMLEELVENTRDIAGVVGRLAERLEPSVQPPQSGQRSLAVEPEVLEAARSTLTAIVDEADSGIPDNPGMERAIGRWREVIANPQATLDSLNEALKGAKSLRAYLNR